MLKEHAEQLTERYVMTTPKFFCGLEGFREASLIMGDVFRHVPKPKEDKRTEDNDWLAEEAQFALLDSITVPSPVQLKYLAFPQMILHWDKDEMSYLNSDDIQFHWRKIDRQDPNSKWVFWVLLPDGYVEPDADGPMGHKLEVQGFIREGLKEPQKWTTKMDYLDVPKLFGEEAW